MTKTSRIPTSKAKTAYGLLSEIAALTLEEPRRMSMGTWGYVGNMKGSYDAPACGTVGCIGGWTEMLKKADNAADVLGLTNEQNTELFFDKILMGEGGQTRRHARHVVAHIRAFQKKYEAQLKAKRV